MQRALALAVRGEGLVEPNPMVGCVIAQGEEIVGEGWHGRFGGPHAEVEALQAAGSRAEGATLAVTLEPCCHFGKTPPCSKAILAAKIARVVVAQSDPFPQVAGGGLEELRAAGVEVVVGVLEEQARRLNAPYLKLLRTGRPWVLAKWAMTLDGKTATRTGSSRWVSCEESLAIVHKIRGRVDAIVVGRETARMDNPLLTARPAGPRTALRVVVDTRASLSSGSQLVETARKTPVLVAVGANATEGERRRLEQAGCEVFLCNASSHAERLDQLLCELGKRRMTNILVEGGGRLAGTLLDTGHIDEVHVFIAPKLVGGEAARSPVDGDGVLQMTDAFQLDQSEWRVIGSDFYMHGRLLHAKGNPGI